MFATFGYTHARFGAGTIVERRRRVGQRDPEHAGLHGVVRRRAVAPAVVARSGSTAAPRSVFYGAFKYDDVNLAGQDAYSLANFRVGARGTRLFVEGWIRNAFDTQVRPGRVRLRRQLAPSGFVGESGRPRTFGITAGVTFLSADAANSRNSATPNDQPTPNAARIGNFGSLELELGVHWEFGVVKLGVLESLAGETTMKKILSVAAAALSAWSR